MRKPNVQGCWCAIAGVVVALCAGCPAPYPAVPHHELAQRILQPSEVLLEVVSEDMEAAQESHPGRLSAPADARNQIDLPPEPPIHERVSTSHPEIQFVKFNSSEPLPSPSGLLPTPAASDSTNSSLHKLTLAAAIDLAYRASPALQSARAKICLAKAGKQIAYADFMPQAEIGFRSITGDTQPTGFIVPTIATDIGNTAFGGTSEDFRLAELRVQWTLWDFGRTTSRFGKSLINEEIAGLQLVRSQQTVAFEVAEAYFETLAAEAAIDVANEAVRRAESVLRDTKNYLNRGTAIRNDVLRADVFVKEMQLERVKAQTAHGVAIAKLNRAIGINSSTPIAVAKLDDTPEFDRPIGDCLQLAVENRREFGVVERGIAKAKLSENLAESDFLPRIYVGGVAATQGQSSPSRHADHLSGGVGIELGLFEGGRRIGRVREAQAEIDLAIARGKEVCDQIAYEVRVAYLAIADAAERLKVQQAAAAQASENLRVVNSQLDQGDAIVTDLIDAQLTLTRAQQGYLIATYDYQTALARLAYAVGLTPEYFLALPVR